MSGLTPYDRGFAAGTAGERGPAFPKADASWSDRLYNRGWEDGTDRRMKRT